VVRVQRAVASVAVAVAVALRRGAARSVHDASLFVGSLCEAKWRSAGELLTHSDDSSRFECSSPKNLKSNRYRYGRVDGYRYRISEMICNHCGF
jgi:hypothetical protein